VWTYITSTYGDLMRNGKFGQDLTKPDRLGDIWWRPGEGLLITDEYM
jgi:hypothetical protein